ncbi:glycosyltransferase [Bacillus sp. 1P10SD]|uniref:glycosyltransferase n=1 Tax=Bacillus sp. 1P10SD TaxID=3132265 RepID=UPI0039A5381E
MKILQIFSTLHRGNGVIEVLKALISRMSKYENVEISSYSNRNYDKEIHLLINNLGANYYYKKNNNFIWSSLEQDVPNIREYDIVHIHGVFTLKNMYITKKIKELGIPYIITLHGNLMEEALKKSKIKKYIARKLIVDWALNNAEAIHVLAMEEKRSLEKIVDNKKVILIPNGLNMKNYKCITKNNIVPNTFRILYLGRLDVIHKGLDLLIDSILLNPTFFRENNVKVDLVGNYSSKRDKRYFDNKIKNSPELNDILVFHGPKYEEDKYEFFQKGDIFIHTSRYEGMPIAVLEAMSYGLPCLVTIGSNMSDIINKSNSGIVSEFNKEEIFKALTKLVSMTKQELEKMGESGRLFLEENLSWNDIVDQYINEYNRILFHND